MRHMIVLVWTLCCMWCLPAHASSTNLVTELAWLEETDAPLSWQEVQGSTGWHRVKNNEVVSLGYSGRAVWFRLRIDANLDGVVPDNRLLLRVRPNYLDELVVYDPAQMPAQRLPIGDRYSKTNQYEPSPFLNLELPAGTQSRDIWVRMKTSSTRQVHFEVMDVKSMRKSNTLLEHVGAVYVSILLVFFTWGCIQLIDRFNRLTFYFVIYQAMAFLFGVSVFGYSSLYLEPWLSPEFIDKAFSVIAVLATNSVALFSAELLDGIQKSRARTMVHRYLQAAFIMAVLLVVASPWPHLGLHINMLIVLIMPFFYFASAMAQRADQSTFIRNIPRPVLIGYFGINMTITLLTALPALKIIPGAEFSLYVVSLYSVSSGLLMLMLLQYKNLQALKQHSLLIVEADNAHRQAQQERLYREETEQLLAMLGHELKTPMSTLLLKVNSPSISQDVSTDMSSSISEMTNIIERTIQIGQINHEKILIQIEQFDLIDLVSQLITALPESHRVCLEISGNDNSHIDSDPYLLSTIVRNLLDNAIKYSPDDALITLQLSKRQDAPCWELLISNPPGRAGWPDANRLFEKYYRSPAATHRSGTGLGLYLVKALATRLGYDLTYCPSSEAIVFKLTLPIVDEVT